MGIAINVVLYERDEALKVCDDDVTAQVPGHDADDTRTRAYLDQSLSAKGVTSGATGLGGRRIRWCTVLRQGLVQFTASIWWMRISYVYAPSEVIAFNVFSQTSCGFVNL